MDCSLPGSSVHRIFWTRILEWVPISYSKGSSQPRDQTRISSIGKGITFQCGPWESPSAKWLHNKYNVPFIGINADSILFKLRLFMTQLQPSSQQHGGFAYQDSDTTLWRGNPQIVWLFVDSQIGVATWLLLSGHVTTTRPTRSSWPSLCNQEGNPKNARMVGKIAHSGRHTKAGIRVGSAPKVSTGIWCPGGATMPTSMTTLEDPWLQPCCPVFLGHCSFSESNSPAFLSVLGAS